MTNAKLTTSNYYLAYLDILGTKDIIAKDKDDKYLNELNEIYERAINTKLTINDWNHLHINAKIFSDNILLFVKADNKNDEKTLGPLISLASIIQCEALTKGYLLRGSITYGNFFENERFVHGQALINAVNLEEKNAIYPRIIIDNNCLDCFKFITTIDGNCLNCNIKEQSSETCIKYCGKKIIKQDNDGFYFVNSYLSHIGGGFSNFKKQLLQILKKYKNNIKVKQKIMWSINYHNKFFINGHCLTSGNHTITEEEIMSITQSEVLNA